MRILMCATLAFLVACAGSRQEQETIQQTLASSAAYYSAKGASALDGRDYERAIYNFREAVKLQPNDPRAQDNLGVAFYQSGQIDSAIFYYQNAIRLQPNYTKAYTDLGYAYILQKNYELALQAAEEALATDASFSNAYILLARVAEESGDWQEAETNYKRALQLDPENPGYAIALATYYYNRGQLNLALQHYQDAARLQPSHAEIYFSIGNTYARKCKLEEARSYYEKALRVNPDLIGALNNHGLILMNQGSYEAAVDDFYHALEIDSTASAVLFNLSVGLQRLDSPVTALNYVSRAIQIDSTYAMFYLQRGNIYMMLGQDQLALQSFQKAINLEPAYALVYNNMGNVLFENNQIEQANSAYERALELYPDFLEQRYLRQGQNLTQGFSDLLGACVNVSDMAADYAMMYNNLGKAKLLSGKLDEAKEDLQRAIHLQPMLIQPYENLAVVYQRQGDQAQSQLMMAQARLNQARHFVLIDSLHVAYDMCQQALSFYPTFAEAYAEIGHIRFMQGDTSAAEQSFEQALQYNGQNANVHLLYADFLKNNAHFTDAAEHFKTAVTLKPDDHEARRLYAAVLDSLNQPQQAEYQRAYAHYLQGKQYEYVGQWDLALEEYQNATNLAPEEALFFAKQGAIYIKKHLYVEAELLLQQALELDPNQVEALYNMGLFKGENKEYAEAIHYLKRAIAQNPDYGLAHYALAINYHNLGEQTLAKQHLQRAQELGVMVRPEIIQQVGS